MFSKIVKLYRRIIEVLAYDLIQRAYVKGYTDRRNYDRENRRKAQLIVAERSLGKKIIYFGNEWEDPSVGEVIGIQQYVSGCDPMLIVENLITKERNLVFLDTFYEFNKEMFNAIMKLSPYERWNVRSIRSHMTQKWTGDKSQVLLGKKDWTEILKKNGWL